MNHLKALAFLFLAAASCGHLLAQDPGFQAARPQRSPTAPAPVVVNGSDEARSVGLINNMEQLDNTRMLGYGDRVLFRIVEDHNAPSVLRIQDSGEILVPHLNLVKAAGRTCHDVAFTIKRELEKSFYKVATVIIALDQAAPRGPGVAGTPNAPEFFTIFGQVQKQGKYELPADEDVSISQAILRAGGFAQFASTKAVKVVRRTPSGNKTVIVNLEDIMTNGSLDHDIFIRNNDVIIVKEKIAQF